MFRTLHPSHFKFHFPRPHVNDGACGVGLRGLILGGMRYARTKKAWAAKGLEVVIDKDLPPVSLRATCADSFVISIGVEKLLR